MEDARAGRFDVVVAEALDRLSRDQEDIAGLYKRLCFAGVQILTLAEGEITDLHVGLKGTMNALFLKELDQKTRRGLRGRVEQGRSGGGKAYGYDVVRRITEGGDTDLGERRINPDQAAIVRRIFETYAAGASPRRIAFQLNQEGVPGPSGTRRSLVRILTNVEAMERACGPDKAAADCKAGNAEVGDRVDDAVDGIKENVEKSVEGVAKEKLEEMIEEIDAEERLRRLNEPEKAD